MKKQQDADQQTQKRKKSGKAILTACGMIGMALLLTAGMLTADYLTQYLEDTQKKANVQQYDKQQVSSQKVDEKLVIPGGVPIGIYLETDGAMVLGTEEICGKDGRSYEPADRVVRAGDYITAINDTTIQNKEEMLEAVEKLTGEAVTLRLRRSETEISVRIKPVETKEDGYKLGIWIRDSAQGIGTITFVDQSSSFGALGHGIYDSDTSSLLEVKEGRLYAVGIEGIQKGEAGKPGGMSGIIVYNRENRLGTITRNTVNGIYGNLDKISELLPSMEPVQTAKREEVEEGEAYIRCAVSGKLENYRIRITKIDRHPKEENKAIVLEVTDERLLEQTGGIVQGMSGSPILQNGKLVGAVTHVFVQNAAKGYGIFIDNMLEYVE